ncbi:MAG: nicotinate (nicotinamide) nucleotide adenylyltransferase [Oscillospiraceae bacterium]|nr:nicotinate (nicotinamide) nucleotide adenylyltransferase [Oscillospiraceae bacterium]
MARKKINKIGIFGGTFNPVHKGHEISGIEFYEKFNLGRLIIIPANIPPHKKNYGGVSPRERLDMCRLCFNKYENDYNIEVSDIEIKKDGVSYTFDTLEALREIYPPYQNLIYFLVGSDMFLELEHWHRYKEILDMCVFVSALRNNNKTEREKVTEFQRELLSRGYKTEIIENNIVEISSTELREKIKRGEPESELLEYLSPEVLNYIKERRIYVL